MIDLVTIHFTNGHSYILTLNDLFDLYVKDIIPSVGFPNSQTINQRDPLFQLIMQTQSQSLIKRMINQIGWEKVRIVATRLPDHPLNEDIRTADFIFE